MAHLLGLSARAHIGQADKARNAHGSQAGVAAALVEAPFGCILGHLRLLQPETAQQPLLGLALSSQASAVTWQSWLPPPLRKCPLAFRHLCLLHTTHTSAGQPLLSLAFD